MLTFAYLITIGDVGTICMKKNSKKKDILGELRVYLLTKAVYFLGNDFRMAEDVVHDVLLSLIKAKVMDREITNIKAYSFKVLKNTIAQRKVESKKMVSIENTDFDHNLSYSYTMDADNPWAEMIDFDDLLKLVDKADADLLKMKYERGMTNVAIAKELKMSEAGVRKRMAKVHDNVKKIIIMKIKEDNEK